MAAQDERIARLENVVGESMPMLEEMHRNADEIKEHLAAMQQILDPRFVSAELLLYRSAYADYRSVIYVLLLRDIIALELAGLQ